MAREGASVTPVDGSDGYIHDVVHNGDEFRCLDCGMSGPSDWFRPAPDGAQDWHDALEVMA